jgi:hypothetical protein
MQRDVIRTLTFHTTMVLGQFICVQSASHMPNANHFFCPLHVKLLSRKMSSVTFLMFKARVPYHHI